MANAETDNGIQFGLIDDVDYKYCYRSMLIEAKEWYQTLKNLEAYLSGKRESQQEKHKEKQKQQKPKNDKNKDDSKNQDIEDE